jgi:hypothetical protein
MTVMMVAVTTTISTNTGSICKKTRLKTSAHSMMENGTMVNVK